MTVHAQSVISPWLNSYYPAFYNALTSQENAAYIADTVIKWQGLFNRLDGQMTVYKQTSRVAVFYDFIAAFYSYYILHNLYGTDGSAIPAGDGRTIFSMNGFTNASIARATNFYNDSVASAGSGGVIGTATIAGGAVTSISLGSGGALYVNGTVNLGISGGGGSGAFATISASTILIGPPATGGILQTPVVVFGGSGYTSPPTVLLCPTTSAKINTDIATITSSVTNENATMAGLQTTYRAPFNPIATRMLFEDVPPLISLPKSQIVTDFFTNMHYKQVYQQLNMAPLTLPPGA